MDDPLCVGDTVESVEGSGTVSPVWVAVVRRQENLVLFVNIICMGGIGGVGDQYWPAVHMVGLVWFRRV